MFNVIIKTVIIYFFAMLIMRMMGKRQAGELQPFELIIAVMIAEVAATPMDSPGTPITYGIIPIVMLLVLHNGIAYLSLKSEKLRAFFSGKPSIVIYKGVVVRHELKRLSYNLNDLLEQLRGKDVMSLADVHYAVLETNGNLSVMLKPQKRMITPEDLQLSPENPGFCYDIIIDGRLKADNLERLGFNETSLMKLLGQNKIRRVKDVFLALCDETGQALVQDYHGSQFTGSIANG
jgi:Predicted membrane protein